MTAALLALGTTQVVASEGGVNNYAIGALTVAPAVTPPPGATEYYGYVLWYNVRSIRNNSGASAIPELRVDLWAHAGRSIHTWTPTLFNGAVHIGSGALYVVDYAKTKVGPNRDEDADIVLVDVEPVILSGAIGNLYWYAGTHAYYPTGHNDPTHFANQVTHYAHYPTFTNDNALTWMPKPWLEASVNTSLSFNMVDHHTGYRSGSLLGVDYDVNVRPFPNLPKLALGVQGFYAQQFTDDTARGVKVPGNRLVKEGAGPQAIWWFTPAVAVVLKWQRNFHVHNGPSGDLAWAEFAFPIPLGGSAPAAPSAAASPGVPPGPGSPADCCPPGPAPR